MGAGWSGASLCHRDPTAAAQGLCQSLHGPTSAGLSACVGAQADPSGSAVLSIATSSATGVTQSSMAVQLQPCVLYGADELAPVSFGLIGLAVALYGATRIPKLFDRYTYGGGQS